MRVTIDELEAERGDVEPFEIDLGDDLVVSLPRPQDVPASRIAMFDSERPDVVLRALMGDEDFDDLMTAEDEDGQERVTLGILEAILLRYNKHFGLPSSGKLRASSRSSRTSARR